MIYRIVATILLIVAIVAVGVVLEPGPSTPAATKSAPGADDSSMKSLRIE